ncbi:MAG: MCE family protein [Burkholderiaceae bacterium]|nr:MCE family protein [Burkholderiaceae bacterium]
MEPRAHHVLIGLFTLVVCTAAVLFALWLAKSKNESDVRNYTVVFNEAVRGLSKGSAVQYNGIRIGDVISLGLDPADLSAVRARIRIDGNIPVTQDTRARLVLTGITGVSVIELSGGTPGSPLLTAPAGSDPIIVASKSPLSQLLAGGDDLMTNISELISNAKHILSPENAQNLSKTLEHLEQVMGAFAEQRNDMQGLMASLTQVTESATQAFGRAATLMDNSNALVSKQGVATLEHAQRAMASLDKTSASLARLIEDNQAAVGQGADGLSQLGPTLQALRETLGAIQTVTRKLDDNPANYLLGREKIQEFQP